MRYDPLKPAVNRNPYPHYDVLRRTEPVCWIDSMQAFAVARYDDVKAVLMNSKDYSSEASGMRSSANIIRCLMPNG